MVIVYVTASWIIVTQRRDEVSSTVLRITARKIIKFIISVVTEGFYQYEQKVLKKLIL